ncbi:MAG: EamA family transporter [Ignavibacteriaceae bacterium]|jgi:drug/metabolite transporter (DMT)-like permease|nr:EamA family transporter [Ignavibacteriaceae bacterium]
MTWFFIALTSALLSAFAAITQKKVLFYRSPLEFSFLLAIVNLVFSIPFFLAVNYATINSFNLSILFVKSIIGVAAFLCVMTALKNLQISNALPLLALTPGFVAVFAFVFLGESLKTTEVLGLISLIIGTYILESKNLKGILFPLNVFIKSKYHLYILSALFLFTASSIMDKLLLVKMNLSPISLTAFQHLFFAILFSIVFFSFRKNREEMFINFRKKDLGWIILISLLTIGYRYTQVVSIGLASVALTLAVKRTSVLWATIIGGKIFKDSNLLKKTIAVLFILLGVILILRD